MSTRKVYWLGLLGCCLALCLAGCAPRIIETPYPPPPPPPKPAPPVQVSHPIFYVAATHLNLRGCAGMDCPKISVLEQNEMVEKIGELDDWYEVIVRRDGRRGWVSSRHLSTEPVTPAVEVPPPPAVTPPAVTPPAVTPKEVAPPPHLAPVPPKGEKPAPVKPPAVEKPKPAKPGEAPAPPKKKPVETKPAKPGEPVRKPPPEKPAPPAVKPPPVEKPAPVKEPALPKEPEPEQPKKIRIM